MKVYSVSFKNKLQKNKKNVFGSINYDNFKISLMNYLKLLLINATLI